MSAGAGRVAERAWTRRVAEGARCGRFGSRAARLPLLALLSLALGGCVAEESGRLAIDVGPPPASAARAVADTLHGTVLEDPYRWLEDQRAPETRGWIEAQNAYTDSALGQLPGREALTDLASSLLRVEAMGTPTERGGRYFFTRRGAEDDLSILYWREGLEGEDRVFLDPHPLSEDHTTSVGYREISDDGEVVIYAIRRGGADEVELRTREVATGRELPDVFPTARYGSVTLSPDRRDLYYVRYGDDRPRVLHHRMGTDAATDRELFGEGYGPEHIPTAQLSDDGRWLLVHVIHGSSGPTEIHIKDLAAEGPWVTAIDDGESRSFASFAGERLVITTDLEAPNRRVLVADPADAGVDRWREVIPEREDAVIQGVSPVGGHYFLSYLEDVQPRVAQYDPEGRLVREIEFETLGSTYGTGGEWKKDEAWVTFTSFHVPSTIYRLDPRTGERSVWFRQEVPVDTDAMEVRQVWFASKDGTRVPMFLVHRRGLERTGDHPTYLTGYGGFNASRTPSFSAQAAAWVELGGVYALPNLRGGGEFGEEWHRAGMLENKQHVFDDFIAAAEWLVEEGYTRPSRLAIAGGSNGGLLVGAAMTQRPDLFGAVVCTYPLLDMVRYHRFLVARFWVVEYGSAEDPEQFAYIRAYSPYHNVRPGTEYPATLFITGDEDTRVDPLHARKMTALLQAAQGASPEEAPILLRYHTLAGHSGGRPVSQQVEDMAETLSFLLWRVGDLERVAAEREPAVAAP